MDYLYLAVALLACFAVGAAIASLKMRRPAPMFEGPEIYPSDVEVNCWEVIERWYGKQWTGDSRRGYTLAATIDRVLRHSSRDASTLDDTNKELTAYIQKIEKVLTDYTQLGHYAARDGKSLREYIEANFDEDGDAE